MKYSDIKLITERIKAQQQIDKTDDSPLKKAVRAPGDVGKVERLQSMHKAKGGAKRTRVPDTAQRMAAAVKLGPEKMAAAKEVLQDVSGVKDDERKKGSVRTPVDYSDPYQYRRKVKSVGKKMGAGGGDFETFRKDGDQKLYGKDATTAADKEFDDIIQQSTAPTARKGIDIPGSITQKDTAAYTHAYQPSGVGVLGKTEYDDEYQNALLGGILDPDRLTDDRADAILGLYDYDKMKEIPIERYKGSDTELKNFDPSPRDLEAMTQRGEDIGKEQGKAYLTPEVMEKQKQLRDALVGQQSDKVQELAFKFDISDEQLDNFIDQFQSTAQRKGSLKKIQSEIKGRGAVEGRGQPAYGGDIGDVPDEAKLDNKGNPLPDGVYNMSKLTPLQKKKADDNRTRELIRTYLKQGGQNAYAPHEGLRSILQMDLEHIKSLQSGGYDSPDNWVWASQNLNRMRGNRDLGPEAQRYVDDKGIRQGADKLSQAVSFPNKQYLSDVFGTDADKKKEFTDKYGEPSGRGKKKGMFDREEYHKMSQADIDQVRMQAQRNYGLSDEQAQTLFPDSPRVAGRSFDEDPEGYARYYETNLRDQTIYRSGLDNLRTEVGTLIGKDPNKVTNDDIKNTDAGKAFMKAFAGLKTPSADEEEVEEVDDLDF